MATNPFEEIKKIMELREMGAISESEAAEMLSIIEKQYQSESTTEIIEEKPKTFGNLDEPTELKREEENIVSIELDPKPKIKINEDKPRVFGDDDDPIQVKKESVKRPEKPIKNTQTSSNRDEKPKSFDFEEESDVSSRRSIAISNKLVYLVAGFGLVFICSFFTAIPASIWDADEDGYHSYLDDDCPDVIGTINGCPDQDKDGVPDNLDKCPTEKGNADGCLDSDGDGVLDKDDDCDTLKGLKENNGCPKTPAFQSDADKLMKGQAVKTPSDGLFQGQNMGQKWLKFDKNRNYEFSNSERTGYKAVQSQASVELLNEHYGLKGVLKKSGTTTTPTHTPKTIAPPKTQNQTPPKPASAEENNIEFSKESARKTNRLTPAEENELDLLLEKEQSMPLYQKEIVRLKMLLRKKG